MIFVPIFAYLINIYGGCTQSKMRPFTAPSHINMKLQRFIQNNDQDTDLIPTVGSLPSSFTTKFLLKD